MMTNNNETGNNNNNNNSNNLQDETLTLESMRNSLIRQEETILFAFIERAQFKRNSVIYGKPKSPQRATNETDGSEGFMEFFLKEIEKTHAKAGRYKCPEEHAFFPNDIPEPILPLLNYPQRIKPNDINLNNKILEVYESMMIPILTDEGDDKNYGSSATCDINCLQALSKRIHFGKLIAEVKFQSSPEEYTKPILNKDRDRLMELLTDKVTEERVLTRVTMKAETYGSFIAQSKTVSHGPMKNEHDLDREWHKKLAKIVAHVYTTWVIPLTKEVEVLYLLERVSHNTASASLPLTISHDTSTSPHSSPKTFTSNNINNKNNNSNNNNNNVVSSSAVIEFENFSESVTKVGYLGPRGTYSYEAACNYFHERNETQSNSANSENAKTEFLPFRTIDDVYTAVLDGKLKYGVVPIENSMEGPVLPSLDKLVSLHHFNGNKKINVVGETVLKVNHTLACRPGVEMENINTVYSHQQALGQCKDWITTHLKAGVKLVEVSSTVKAAEMVAKGLCMCGTERIETTQNKGVISECVRCGVGAAVCSRSGADLMGLILLAEDIQDNPENQTRFLVINSVDNNDSDLTKTTPTNPPIQTPNNKDYNNSSNNSNNNNSNIDVDSLIGGGLQNIHTLLAFTVGKDFVTLGEVMDIFVKDRIEVTRIHNRSVKNKLWRLTYLIEVCGEISDINLRNAVNQIRLKYKTKGEEGNLTVFGSFRSSLV